MAPFFGNSKTSFFLADHLTPAGKMVFHEDDEGVEQQHREKIAKTLPSLADFGGEGEVERQKPRLIVVLESACLEIFKSGRSDNYQLLNSDDHAHILKKLGKPLTEARPDITHSCLLSLLDSPLNKAGLLQVYIHTKSNVLIQVNPHVRIPRTFRRFSGLMIQLLHKLSIRAVNGSEKLLKVIKNPITDHLPLPSRKYGIPFSFQPRANISQCFLLMLPRLRQRQIGLKQFPKTTR